MNKKTLWNGPGSRKVVQAVGNFLQEKILYNDISQDVTLYMALSGGPDSLALTAAVAKIFHCPDPWENFTVSSDKGRRAPAIRAIIIDHQLQENSYDFSLHAQNQAHQLGVEAEIVPVIVESRWGLEADARFARYHTLQNIARDQPILLGHTLDDQAETVFLGLVRGSGPRSLRGMPKVRGNIYRPLLDVRRKDTMAACHEWSLKPVMDIHNFDPRFLRSRLRGTVIPLLASELNSSIAHNLARTAILAAEDTEILDAIAQEITDTATVESDLAISAFAQQPKGIRTRVVRLWLYRKGFRVTYDQLDAIDHLVDSYHGQGGVAISKEIIAPDNYLDADESDLKDKIDNKYRRSSHHDFSSSRRYVAYKKINGSSYLIVE